MKTNYKYLAFISYKREDEQWAKWLQHKLEHYKLPTSVRKIDPTLPERVRPVFKDTTDLAGGVLEKAIKKALDASKYLIVICSPRAAQSPWVCKEVQEFIDSGREEFIIPFIVEGEPNSRDEAKECFPRNLRDLSGERELLGININEMGRDAAAIKVVARMFKLQFDVLWQRWEREQRTRRRWIVGLSLLGVMVAFSIVGIMYSQHRKMQKNQARAVAQRATQLVEEGDSYLARKLLVEVLPDEDDLIPRPYVPEAEMALRHATNINSGKFNGHSKYINSIQFNDNGNFIISASQDKTIRLWDIESGRCMRIFEGHNNVVIAATFSVDNKKIISVSKDWTIRIWNIITGQCESSTTWNCGDESSDYEYEIIFSPTRDYMVVNAIDGSIIRFWDIKSGKLIHEFKEHVYPVKSFALSNDGKYLVSRSAETIKVWDIELGISIKTFNEQTDVLYNEISTLYGCVLLPSSNHLSNERYLASCCYNPLTFDKNTISLLQLEKNDIITKNNKNYSDSTIILGQGGNNILRDYYSEEKSAKYYDNLLVSWGVMNVISQSGKYIASLDNDNISILHTASGEYIKWPREDNYNADLIYSMSFSSDDKSLIIVSREYIKLWDVKSGRCKNTIPNFYHSYPMAYSTDKKYVATRNSHKNTINIIDLYSGLSVRKFFTRPLISDVKFSPNGKYIALGYYMFVEILDIKSGKCIKRLGDGLHSFDRIHFHPNGEYVILTTSNHTVQIWKIDYEKCVQTFESNEDDIIAAYFGNDGKQIILITESNQIKLVPFKLLQELIDETKQRFKDVPLTDKERREYYLE